MRYERQKYVDKKTPLNTDFFNHFDEGILGLQDQLFYQVANPIELSSLNGKKIVCFGDSITQGTSLGNPTTEKNADANGQIYPAITDEELAKSIPVGTRGASYPYYLGKLGAGLSVDNLGSGGWALPTGYTLQSKINGYNGDTPTATSNIHTLKSKYEVDPYAITVMFGVNEFTRNYPLGKESNLYEKDVLTKLSTYELTYIRWKKANGSEEQCYVDGEGNVVAVYDSNTELFSGITDSCIDDINKKIYVLTDTIYGAWEYVALRLKKDFVTSKIIFMTPYLFRGTYNSNYISEPNKAGYYFKDMMDVIISTGLKYRIPVLDNFYKGGVTIKNAWQYMGDGCHLSYRGGIAIAKNILEFLLLNPVVLSPKWLQPGGRTDEMLEGSGSADVDDNVVHVESVSLDKASLTLSVGETYQFKVTIVPDNAENKTVTFASSDNSIATVSSAGLVTAIATGTAVITCLTDDGGMNNTCDVHVN